MRGSVEQMSCDPWNRRRAKVRVLQEAILRDRARGVSVRDLAKLHRISRTSVTGLLQQQQPCQGELL